MQKIDILLLPLLAAYFTPALAITSIVLWSLLHLANSYIAYQEKLNQDKKSAAATQKEANNITNLEELQTRVTNLESKINLQRLVR